MNQGKSILGLPFLFISRSYQSSGSKRKLLICERNLAFMWVCGNARIQLESFPLRVPRYFSNRP